MIFLLNSDYEDWRLHCSKTKVDLVQRIQMELNPLNQTIPTVKVAQPSTTAKMKNWENLYKTNSTIASGRMRVSMGKN